MALLRRFLRLILIVAGFICLALLIWFAGPFLAFAEYRPLEMVPARIYTIAAIIGAWLIWRLIRRLRAYQLSDKLVAAVIQQASPSKAPPSAEAVKLRERFEEAALTLKQKRRGGHSLYELPWYVIIGAPGSGKTTALVNSGLKFPLETKGGRALKGVGGTRNCDWWFAEEAVYLDTAGRYTTQDSDASSDAEGWAEFLGLLRKYRGRRPINGVILTISAHDLMVQNESKREEHVEAARRRLLELNRELRIKLPVYLMVTKCDLVAGFTEYFDDLTLEGRAQVWGVTFPYSQTMSGDAPHLFSAEFDALMERLNHRVAERVEEDRDIRRRTRIFAFPQQMAALHDPLNAFVTDVFASSHFEQQVLLRGVYLTSGTQEGTPIDRLLGAMIRGFGLSSEAVAPAAGRGKAYFVERLLKEVMIGESGIAGVDTRGEVAKAAVHLGAYAAAALVAALVIVALTVSHGRNQAYLARVRDALATFQKQPPVSPTAPPERLLARLNAVRGLADSANQFRDDVPRAMTWGLYQGRAIGDEATAAYRRTLDRLLIPQITTRFRQRVVEWRGDPAEQLDTLKAYLMLNDPDHLDREFLRARAETEWGASRAGDGAMTLATHIQSRLDDPSPLPPTQLDQAVIARARASLQSASIARILYREIQRQHSEGENDVARSASLERIGAEGVIRRRSGISLAQSLPSLYTKAVFTEVTDLGSGLELMKKYAADQWVLGESTAEGVADAARLRNEVVRIYEEDYITTWERVLRDLELVPVTEANVAKVLEVLSGPSSPLRVLASLVAENTRFSPPATPAPGLIESAKRTAEKVTGSLQRASGMTQAGQRINAHFQAYHRLLDGDPGQAPIDRMIALLSQLNIAWVASTGGDDIASKNGDPAVRTASVTMRQAAQTLPPDMSRLVVQLPGDIEHAVEMRVMGLDAAKKEDERKRVASVVDLFRNQVVVECERIVAGRYPFTQGSDNNLPLIDFGRLFAPDGILDSFFKTQLAPLTDTSVTPWRFIGEAEKELPAGMLRVFQNAADVRDAFFQGGTKVPRMQFTAMVLDFDETAATRFRLDVEGAVLDSAQRRQAWTIRWPGEKPGLVQVMFDGRFATPYVESFHGPWAWFKLLERSKLTRESDIRNVLTVSVNGMQANIAIEALTVHNPFATADWQRFKCGF